ncbi:hypothetical protein GGR16_002438 [Chelatococcus caeni]|uniref:Uncharacterized protein n=1 Tax=Chelatococcus caeni TaxID=1348468 RepID=A0A840C1N8_9HYPH|nr:hypothetical protein [Chelatococcus caeni]MBB4017409.1 hypothetical protein [Chelatococcus caeni]
MTRLVVTLKDNGSAYTGYRVELVEAPELVGSEKQVAWAKDIRAKALDEVADMVARAAQAHGMSVGPIRLDDPAEWIDETKAKAAALTEKLAGERALIKIFAQSGAKWWIDRRDLGLAALAKEVR